jgi:regulator of replication initiation timing
MSLPPAVPPYRPDHATTARLLGEAHSYITQLHEEMSRRAEEANRLHDENAALRAQLAAALKAQQPETQQAT